MSHTPVFIPIVINQEPEKCPSCNKEENKVVVCDHCGHKYEEDETTASEIIAGCVVIVAIVWFTVTVIWWLADQGRWGGNSTLLDTVLSQWEFVKQLRLW